MIRTTLLSLALLVGSLVSAFAQQGITFFDGSYDEALSAAKADGKLVFIDAYAVWCGPCKRMSNQVFPRSDVGDFYNEHFVSLKLDMERGAGKAFQKLFPVSSYPTLLFLDANGELVQRVVGAQDAKNLIAQGKQALRRADNSDEYAQRYRDGERDPKFVVAYIKSLNAAGEPSLAVANEYLRERTDHDNKDVQAVIYEATIQADSRIFGMFIEQRAALESTYGKQAVANRIEDACTRTMQTALTYDSQTLVEEAKVAMAEHMPSRAKAFEAEADLALAKKRRDSGLAYKAAKRVVNARGGGAAAHHAMALELRQNFPDQPKVISLASRFAGTAAKSDPSFDHLFTYAELLDSQGKTKKALSQATRARDGLVEGDDPRRAAMVDDLIDSLQ